MATVVVYVAMLGLSVLFRPSTHDQWAFEPSNYIAWIQWAFEPSNYIAWILWAGVAAPLFLFLVASARWSRLAENPSGRSVEILKLAGAFAILQVGLLATFTLTYLLSS